MSVRQADDESRGGGQRNAWENGTHENLPAACLVTAAAIPPLSLACLLSFLEPMERRVSRALERRVRVAVATRSAATVGLGSGTY